MKSSLRLGIGAAVAVALLVLGQANHCTGQATIQALGAAPGGSAYFSSKGFGVSDDGRIVTGYGATDFKVGNVAFRWDVDTGVTILEPLQRNEAHGISGDGEVIVGYGDFVIYGGSGSKRTLSGPFRWDEVNEFDFLSHSPSSSAVAYGASLNGDFIVGGNHPKALAGEAFRWDEIHGMTSLGQLNADYRASSAYDVSADGHVVVGVSLQTEQRIGIKRTRAFRWDPINLMQPLTGLPGYGYDAANAISPDGTIIVGRSENDAYLWDSLSGNRSLGRLNGNESEAFDVSADGRVVVGSAIDRFAKGRKEAFVWTSDRGMRRLRDALLDWGVDPNELKYWARFDEARGVSADGSVIVGYGHRKYIGDTAFRIEIGPSNSAPTVSGMKSVTAECTGEGADVDVRATVFDADGDDLTVTWSIRDANGDTVEITDLVAIGADPVTIHLTDGSYQFGMGANIVQLCVSDGIAKKVCPKPIKVSVVDTTAPFTVSMMNVEVGTDLGECFATVDLTSLEYAPEFSDQCNPEEITVTNNAPENNQYTVGTHEVLWTVSDGHGNIMEEVQTVTVVDDEAPEITTVPEDVVVAHDAGECHADIVLADPEATDNCEVVSIIPDPVGPYPVGVTVVTWTAQDAAGNQSLPVTQTVTVTNEAPVADAGPNQVLECDGSGAIAVTLDGSASYDPDGDAISYKWEAADVEFDDPTSATPTGTFPDGSTCVTLWVEDHCGAITETSVLVIIQDTTAPQIQAADVDKGVLWPPNHKMTPISLFIEVSDLCTAPEDLLLSCVVTSSEADDAEGDGKFVGDVDFEDGSGDGVSVDLGYNAESGCWEGMMNLRAERSGNGDGRQYTIRCYAMDESGNVTAATVVVAVPHSLGGKKK